MKPYTTKTQFKKNFFFFNFSKLLFFLLSQAGGVSNIFKHIKTRKFIINNMLLDDSKQVFCVLKRLRKRTKQKTLRNDDNDIHIRASIKKENFLELKNKEEK